MGYLMHLPSEIEISHDVSFPSCVGVVAVRSGGEAVPSSLPTSVDAARASSAYAPEPEPTMGSTGTYHFMQEDGDFS